MRVLTLDVIISKEIEYRIECGDYPEGSRLPSERALADEFRVHRDTIRRAMEILIDKSLIETKPRSGYYVAPRRIDFNLDAYNSRKAVIEQMGKSTYVKLLTFDRMFVTDKIARKTGLKTDSQMFRIMRLRYAGGSPMALERAHIRYDLAPNITEEDVHNKSLYAALRRVHSIYINRAESKVSAVYANGLESELLHLPVSKPAMRYEGLVYDSRDRLVEYFDDIIRIDKVQFIRKDVLR